MISSDYNQHNGEFLRDLDSSEDSLHRQLLRRIELLWDAGRSSLSHGGLSKTQESLIFKSVFVGSASK